MTTIKRRRQERVTNPSGCSAVVIVCASPEFDGDQLVSIERWTRRCRPREEAFDRPVVGSVTLRGDKRIGEPKVLPADKSPTGVAHVLLRIDALTLRVFDQAALDAHTRAWAEGYQAVEEAFGQAPSLSIEALMHRAAQQARSPYLLNSLSEISRQMPGRAPGHPEKPSELRSLL